jgi:hypothetical protein
VICLTNTMTRQKDSVGRELSGRTPYNSETARESNFSVALATQRDTLTDDRSKKYLLKR